MRTSAAFLSVPLILVGIAFSPSAHAYLDPGTGSFILQSLIAGAFAAMVYFRLAWAQTKHFFQRLFGGAQSTMDDEVTDHSATPSEREEIDR